MARTILSAVKGVNNSSTTTAGATQYWYLASTTLLASTGEAAREIIYREAATFERLYVRVIANTTTANSTVVVRKNGADTAMTVTITAGTAEAKEDAINTVSITPGDRICFKTVSGGTGTLTFSIVSVIHNITQADRCISRHAVEGYPIIENALTRFLSISGDRSGVSSTEPPCESTIKVPTTARNAYLFVSANTRTTDTTFTLRKNRADTAIVLTVAAGFTGPVEDTTNLISYAIDDEISWEISAGASAETITFSVLVIDLQTDDNKGMIFAGAVGASALKVQNANTTEYYPIGGSIFGDAIEANTKQKARTAFTLSALTIRVSPNGVTATSTLRLKVNGVAVNNVVSIASGGINFFVDTTHTDLVTADDDIGLELTTGATGTSLTITQLGIYTTAPVEVITTVGSGGGSQGRSPLYRQVKRREPEIAIAIVRVRIPLQYEVEKLSVQVKGPVLVPQKPIIKYASAILNVIEHILPLPIKPTPPPPVQSIVRVSVPITYEVTNLQLKAACSYEVDRLFTQEQQHKIVAASINFLLADLI